MKKIIFSIIIAAFTLQACSLEENPTSFVNADQYYKNVTQCTAALDGCYLPMASIFTADYMLAVEACTDIWYSGSSTKDACLEITQAKPQFGATMWRQGYLGVMRANECVDCINASPLKDEVKKPLQAEARVLRALYYYILTCNFNGVPFYMERVATDQDLIRIRELPRTDANEIRSVLYDDLKTNAIPYFTAENGYKKPTSQIAGNRLGYAVGLMLMAKMAMWNEDWSAAIEPLKKLEELYGEFNEERYPLEQTMWRYKNTAESILEIQHDWSRTGVQYKGNVAPIMTPSHTADSTGGVKIYLYDGVSIPELGNECVSWSALKANNNYGIFRTASGTAKAENTAYADKIFNPLPLTYADEYSTADGRWYVTLDTLAMKTGMIRGQKVDRRVYYVLGLGNYDTAETFNTTYRYGVGWAGPKFWCPGLVQSYDSNNYKIFRYADAILMLAECYSNLQEGELAMEYLNKTRARAGVDPVDNFVGYEALLVQIRAERARELGGEFMRKHDLVRWGIWYEQTYANNQSKYLKERIQPCHRYYPIPEQQCSISNGHLSNPEYDACGL